MPKDCRLKISTLEDIWDILLVGCVSLDAEGARWTKSNELTSEFLGYTDAELKGKYLQAVTSPADWAIEKESIKAVLRGLKDSYTLSKQFITRDGRARWARVQANRVTPEDDYPFLVYQILPGEVDLVNPATPPALAAPVEEKGPSPLLNFLKQNWKNLFWLIGTICVALGKGYHAVDSWRRDQETKVESLNQDIKEVKQTAENNQNTLDTLNSNIEILIKSLDK